MPQASKPEVKTFFFNNISFFMTPLYNPQEFYHVYQRCNALEVIKDYSDKLKALLYKHQEQLNEDASTPVIYSWNRYRFNSAFEHQSIRDFIIDNKKHPAIKLWRKERKLLLEFEYNEDKYNNCKNTR